MRRCYTKFFFSSFLIIALQIGCTEISANLNSQDRFGEDYAYFAALRALQDGNESEAVRLFKQGAKNASGVVKRKCAEELTRLGTIPDRIKAGAALAAEWKDDAAYLRTAEEFFAAREYREIITLTDNYKTEDNELLRYRISSLAEKKDSRLLKETSDWLLKNSFSESQRMFVREYGISVLSESDRLLFSVRESVFLRRYDEAFGKLSEILQTQENPAVFFSALSFAALSDIGRIFLYGDSEYIKNALIMERAAEAMKIQGINAFYPFFYAGRLYDRSGGQNEWLALDRFQKAMNEARELNDDLLYDNALWYYLSGALKISTQDTIAALEQFGATFRDKSYYDDFFDTLALGLLNGRQWNSFFSVAQTVERFASGESRSKYAYLAGRLLKTKLVRGTGNTAEEAEEWFRKACEPGGNIYYTLLASRELGISYAELERGLFSKQPAINLNAAPPLEIGANRLLLGYAEHGFPERIYDEWRNYAAFIDLETAIKLADFLQNCGEESLKIQGLRIISRTVLNGTAFNDLSNAARALKLVYPQFFKNEIESVSAEFDIPSAYIFALTRSESFFESGVSSHAGARGLTQLMDATAADIARKLKVADYDLFDAPVNLRFGTFYFAELQGRLDGNILAAYFAYNAGITRVRTWLSNAKDLPQDIFLETIPFAETRQYGKNVITALCFYALLYENTPVNTTLNQVLK